MAVSVVYKGFCEYGNSGFLNESKSNRKMGGLLLWAWFVELKLREAVLET